MSLSCLKPPCLTSRLLLPATVSRSDGWSVKARLGHWRPRRTARRKSHDAERFTTAAQRAGQQAERRGDRLDDDIEDDFDHNPARG